MFMILQITVFIMFIVLPIRTVQRQTNPKVCAFAVDFLFFFVLFYAVFYLFIFEEKKRNMNSLGTTTCDLVLSLRNV